MIRGNELYPPEDLEPGVKFFILALEELGCQTQFSCEGHPIDFYIVFETQEYELLRVIAECGYFIVEVCWQPFWFRLSLDMQTYRCGMRSEKDRNKILTRVAKEWVKRFNLPQTLLKIEQAG